MEPTKDATPSVKYAEQAVMIQIPGREPYFMRDFNTLQVFVAYLCIASNKWEQERANKTI